MKISRQTPGSNSSDLSNLSFRSKIRNGIRTLDRSAKIVVGDGPNAIYRIREFGSRDSLSEVPALF